VGKRNQILEIDILNTTVTGNQDTIAVSSSGGGSATYNTSSSYVAPSSY
jgi:hypothetical protein